VGCCVAELVGVQAWYACLVAAPFNHLPDAIGSEPAAPKSASQRAR